MLSLPSRKSTPLLVGRVDSLAPRGALPCTARTSGRSVTMAPRHIRLVRGDDHFPRRSPLRRRCLASDPEPATERPLPRSGQSEDELGDTSKENPAMRTMKVVACSALVIVLTLLVPVSAQVSDFTTIDVPGASSTLPRGINSRGDIVGFYGVGGAFHAFLFHEGTFTDIDVPGAAFTRPRSINPQGDVVGFYGTGSVSHGFLLLEGSFTT